MKKLFSALTLFLGLSPLACVVDATSEEQAMMDEDSNIRTKEAALMVSLGGGKYVEWTLVGHPGSASKIAATGTEYTGISLYALNNDRKLYRGNGSDSGWSYVDWPSGAKDIGSDGGNVAALNDDNSVWTRLYNGWKRLGAGVVSKAENIGEELIVLKTTDAVVRGTYTYPNYSNATFSSYNTALAGTTAIGMRGNNWFFVKSNALWFAGPYSFASAYQVTLAGKNVRDIAVWGKDTAYVLTEDRDLYKARLEETACTDNYDNDLDGVADFQDTDCHQAAGLTTCLTYPVTGYTCISRVGGSGHVLAQCKSSWDGGPSNLFVKLSYGTSCQLKSPGSDYLLHIK